MTLTEIPPISWSFGEILAKLRKDADLAPEQLAPEADISVRTVWNYEHDETLPKWSTVLLWAKACNYPHVEELRATWEQARASGCISDEYQHPRLFHLPDDLAA